MNNERRDIKNYKWDHVRLFVKRSVIGDSMANSLERHTIWSFIHTSLASPLMNAIEGFVEVPMASVGLR